MSTHHLMTARKLGPVKRSNPSKVTKMKDEPVRKCVECEGRMSQIVVMDKLHPTPTTGSLEYRLPDDKPNFWTGKFPTAGPVLAFMCEGCGRIALSGAKAES